MELVPVVGVIAVAGPPVVTAGVIVLLALMVAGPFVVVLTLALAALLAAAAVVALAGVTLALPYLLVRRLHTSRVPLVARRRVVA
jgi:hypothetical protein